MWDATMKNFLADNVLNNNNNNEKTSFIPRKRTISYDWERRISRLVLKWEVCSTAADEKIRLNPKVRNVIRGATLKPGRESRRHEDNFKLYYRRPTCMEKRFGEQEKYVYTIDRASIFSEWSMDDHSSKMQYKSA